MIAHCVSVNAVRIKDTSHLVTLNDPTADLEVLKHQQNLAARPQLPVRVVNVPARRAVPARDIGRRDPKRQALRRDPRPLRLRAPLPPARSLDPIMPGNPNTRRAA